MASDTEAIAELRHRIQAAEDAGDADAIVALMTDDVVAMVPTVPVIEGREDCARFVRETLAELLELFHRVVRYRSAETSVLGDMAWDRGTFTISCVSRRDGVHEDVHGKYLWLLRREPDGWRIARLIHSIDEPPERAPEALASDRLRLARPSLADAPEIFERYASDPEVTRYLGWPTHRSVTDTECFVRFSEKEWSRSPGGPYLIRSVEDGRVLGSTGLVFEGTRRATTGYVLARDAWGRGYATQALKTMVALAGILGVARLQAVCHADHAASRRVLEKCGFRVDESATPDAQFPNLEPDVPRRAVLYVIEPPPQSVDKPLL